MQIHSFEDLFAGKCWPEDAILGPDDHVDDPALPTLAGILLEDDLNDWVLKLLKPYIAGSDNSIVLARIVYCRHSPGEYFLICFGLHLRNHDGTDAGRQLLTCKIVPPDQVEFHQLYRQSKLRANTIIEEVVIRIPEWGIVATVFPNDLRLARLNKILRRGRLRARMSDILEIPIERISRRGRRFDYFDIHSYKPERSCLIGLTIRSDIEGNEKRRILARIYRGKKGTEIFAGMQLLWQSPQRVSGKISLAEPLGYDGKNRLLLQSHLKGAPLSNLSSDPDYPSWLQAAGQSLAYLHGVSGSLNRERHCDNQLDHYLRFVELPSSNINWIRQQSEDLLSWLSKNIVTVSNRPKSIIHGDFSVGQVLVKNEKISLIDFDQICVGDPYEDLANFSVRLVDGLLPTWGYERAQIARSCFITGYRQNSEMIWDASAFAWHEKLTCFRLAASSALYIRPGWKRRCSTSLAFARRITGE